MKPNWLLNNLETSQAFRLTLEIVIALVLFSWLPLVFQIIAGLIVSVVCEIIFAKIITRNLKNKFSGEALSRILNNSQKR
jgi:membrane protease YdiL (CAAX protease family)